MTPKPKRRRAKAGEGITYSLPPEMSEYDVGLAKGMILRGDELHHITAFFGENSARIAELKSGKRCPHIAAITERLPPVGPYLDARREYAARTDIFFDRSE